MHPAVFSGFFRAFACRSTGLGMRKFCSQPSSVKGGLGLSGRTAIITGSTSGIGLGIAKALSSENCNVLLTGFIESDKIADLKHEVNGGGGGGGGRVEYVACDLADLAEVAELCRSSIALFPAGVDILVNNAGFQNVCPVEGFPVESWEAMLRVMLTAPFVLVRQLLPAMRRRRWGRVVNVASAHGHVASANKSAYCAAKHGLVGFTKAVALESAESGVTCNALCPGYVETPILRGQIEALARQRQLPYEEAKGQFLESFHPTKRATTTQELGQAVLFLCSPAASNMTGSSLLLDGGWTVR